MHAISGKTLKTAVFNTSTHIYKMKRKKKDFFVKIAPESLLHQALIQQF
jgi:hypothetical protein